MPVGTQGRKIERSRKVNGLVGEYYRRKAVTALCDRVNRYRMLQPNWDTYGGKPPCKEAVAFCVTLLCKLGDIPLPTVAPISTGVMLMWKGKGRNTYFEVDDESVLYGRRLGDVASKYDEDLTYNVENAVELLKQLHSQGML